MKRICNILVVEDDDAVRDLLGEILDFEGYEFTLARNGGEMHAALERDQFDVAVLDVSLAGEDGMALAEVASASGCNVIMTTGDPMQRARLEASGRRHLLKPFRIQEITEVVDELLNGSGALCKRRGACDDDPAPRAAA